MQGLTLLLVLGVAFLLSAHFVECSDCSYRRDYGHRGERQARQKRYRFMIGRDFGPYEYEDDRTGVRIGFHKDLLIAVCHQAGKTCNYLMDRYTNCWDVDHPGQGLLDDWYDACIGVYPTPERYRSFNFSASYTQNFPVALHYRNGPIVGDPADLTGRRVGFVKGWSITEGCLARQSELFGNQPGEYTAVFFQSHSTMMNYLQTGRIDVVVAMPQYITEDLGLQAAGPTFYCTKGGLAVMARYSKQNVLDWWNETFERMVREGDFRRLCQRSQGVHGARGELYCVE